MKVSNLTNERGDLTPRALAAGHQQKKENVTLSQICEGSYDVVAYGLTNKLTFWESFDNLTHAREAFREQVQAQKQ